MKRKRIDSSAIKSAGYRKNTMQVEFNNGSLYNYADVPKSEFNTLIGAQSAGKHFKKLERKA